MPNKRTRQKAISGPGASGLQLSPGKDALVCVFIAAAVFAVYWPVRHFDFVNYDDPAYISSNPPVLGGLTWANIYWAFTYIHASNWHPITWLSLMLDCQLFGENPGANHVVNVCFHALNSILLYLLLAGVTKQKAPAAIVAGLFALHPLHVESVAWISERKDVLSTAFFLATLLAYATYSRQRYAQIGAERIGKAFPHRPYLWSLFFCACGLLSKPMLVTMPIILWLFDFWPGILLQTDRDAESEKTEIGWRSYFNKQRVLDKLPFLGLSILFSAITFYVQRKGGAVSSLTTITLSGRLENAVVSYIRYLGKMFWPVELAVLYPHPLHWPIWKVAACLVALILISGAVIWQRRARPFLFAGWFWFLCALIPVIGIVQVGLQSMADRYTYIPLIGVFFALVRLGNDFVTRAGLTVVKLALVVAGVILFACALATRYQLQYWANSEVLFRRTVSVTKDNFLAYNNLGFHLSKHGKIDEAIENYYKAIAIHSCYEDALNNLGYAYEGKKEYQKAIGFYERALRCNPNHVEVHNNLGNAFADIGDIDKAMAHYEFVLAHDPSHADANSNYGIALAMKGRLDEAIQHFEKAIKTRPNFAGAHSNLGNAYAAKKNWSKAIAEYLISLKLDPKDSQAENNLGNVLCEQGQLEEGIVHYQKALQLNPENPEGNFNLGVALEKSGQLAQALLHFREAVRLRPNYPEAQAELQRLSSRAH
jgi:tetratricopeptide (TPR) repeat protein